MKLASFALCLVTMSAHVEAASPPATTRKPVVEIDWPAGARPTINVPIWRGNQRAGAAVVSPILAVAPLRSPSVQAWILRERSGRDLRPVPVFTSVFVGPAITVGAGDFLPKPKLDPDLVELDLCRRQAQSPATAASALAKAVYWDGVNC